MLHEIAPHQYHLEYSTRQPGKGDILLICRKGTVLCRAGQEEIEYPTADQIKVTGGQYLFSIDDQAFFLPRGLEEPIPEGWELRSIQTFRTATPKHLAYAGWLGSRLALFYAEHRYCGQCGGAAIPSTTERAVVCPSCKAVYYPQISPSVIVALVDGDRILLTKYQASHSSYRNYALIAGYNETGETLEETVRREVAEEVGLRVEDITYYKSQPWPLSGALLAGFFCRLKGSDSVTLETQELSEARWVSREELEPRPDSPSLTGEMIEQFRLGLDPLSQS